MRKSNFLAFDIGATSGRAMLGTMDECHFELREIHRFANPLITVGERMYWDIYALYASLVESLRICARASIQLDSIGIDTWGVDFGFVVSDGSLLNLPRAYRDPFTNGVPDEFFRTFSAEDVYRRTGIQVMSFNSLFQLYKMNQGRFVPQQVAQNLLFIPDLLAYMLTGNRVCEYTVATTSQLLNATTGEFDADLLQAVGVSSYLMAPLVMPGTTIGLLSDTIARETGIGKVPVVAVASHDTASAVIAAPALTRNFAYVSSGTWSLMGIETEQPILNEVSFRNNFTNEGGIEGTTRFLKNITGMWILEQCREQWLAQGKNYSYEALCQMAQTSRFSSLICPDDPHFSCPTDMLAEISAYCKVTDQALPVTDADVVRCIFYSLANRYREVLEMLETMSPFPIECLQVIGGGSKNDLLNQLTANAIGRTVIAGPAEATAIGNCMVQAKAKGWVRDRWEMRQRIATSSDLRTFLPQ